MPRCVRDLPRRLELLASTGRHRIETMMNPNCRMDSKLLMWIWLDEFIVSFLSPQRHMSTGQEANNVMKDLLCNLEF